ncbi:patatin-like phospholipase family protein [Phenylobacterium sp.]|uniref:patatin-like phospholipase family protein n=1 Tax=Phenylobacterium sp. TaxID=1871053 RepID=UPI002810A115|nr:patatin-like phospholipase family protein [Phenylobacterium sp.]
MMELAERNLALKGGVTSGLVYAGALPVLAARYRFRAVAGSSAGAIAAAFAAAAEYARSRGDPGGFARLQRRSAELPHCLASLFQASPGFEPLLKALVHLAPGTGKARIGRAILGFWPDLVTGALAGGALWVALSGAADAWRHVLGGSLLALLGAVAAVALRVGWLLFRVAPRRNFGICPGLSQGGGEALTDWLHAALQEIAFGPEPRERPLTLRDLTAMGVDLRIVATNLATARPEVTPRLGAGLAFRPAEWARLFPPAVMRCLAPESAAELVPIPAAELPVLVAVRASLACPALMEAVPAVAPDGGRVWFSDGGLTTNFPFQLFERDPHPTVALDLDTLHPDDAGLPRARTLDPAEDGRTPDLTRLRPFVWSLLVALREGRLRAAAREPGAMPIHQGRLTADEGGMNLAMSEGEAPRLMAYGEALGAHILAADPAPVR